MIPRIEREICTACEACLEICPPGAISLAHDCAVIVEDICEECGFCVAQCPVGAITIQFPMSGKK